MKAKQILSRLVVVAVSVFVSIVLIEIALGVWTPSPLQYKAVRRADPVFHHSPVPSSHYLHHTRDFTMDVRTNSLGFRDREHASNPANAYGLLVFSIVVFLQTISSSRTEFRCYENWPGL